MRFSRDMGSQARHTLSRCSRGYCAGDRTHAGLRIDAGTPNSLRITVGFAARTSMEAGRRAGGAEPGTLIACLTRDRRAAVRLLEPATFAGRDHPSDACRVVERELAARLVAAGRAALLSPRWLRAWDARCRLVAADQIRSRRARQAAA